MYLQEMLSIFKYIENYTIIASCSLILRLIMLTFTNNPCYLINLLVYTLTSNERYTRNIRFIMHATTALSLHTLQFKYPVCIVAMSI